jgi:RHS repeat-associated protein
METYYFDAKNWPFSDYATAIYTYDAPYPYAHLGTCRRVANSTGKLRDSESGLDNFGRRFYSGSAGRFVSPDPLDASAHPAIPQSWNRYLYTLNNPLRYVDVKGTCTSPAVGQGQVGICIGLYISSRTIGGLGQGDGRGPRANDPKATYRVEIQLVVDPAKHTVSTTKNDAGVTKVILPLPPPLTATIENKGTSVTSVSTPTTDDKGTTHFNVMNDGMNGLHSLNVGGYGAPTDSIKTSLNLDATQDGRVGVEGGARTAYPSLEVYSYDPSGNATPILQIQETTPDALKKQDQQIPVVQPQPPPQKEKQP